MHSSHFTNSEKSVEVTPIKISGTLEYLKSLAILYTRSTRGCIQGAIVTLE